MKEVVSVVEPDEYLAVLLMLAEVELDEECLHILQDEHIG